MKKTLKWIVTHEPALFGGLFVAVGVFLVVRYGAQASAVVQALSGSSVLLAFGTLRNFVTSPAGRAALTDIQTDVTHLPQLTHDVNTIYSTLAPAIQHPKGLIGFLESHYAALKTDVSNVAKDLHGNTPIAPPVPTSGGAVNVAPAPAAVGPDTSGDAFADLGTALTGMGA